jgi:pimeloyl-ACP methyl ester carboxylesterase
MSSRAKTTSAVPRSSQRKKTPAAEPSATAARVPVRVERQGFAIGCDDTPIYFTVTGVTDGPVVVLCDGVGCDGYIWKYIAKELSDRYLVVHFHYRGHGRTPPPRDRRRVEIVDLSDDLLGVLDTAVPQGGKAALLGHSMGVQVALETYRRHPDRVSSLGLLCGSYGTPLRTFKGKQTLEQVLPFIAFAVNRIPNVVSSVWRSMLPTELAFQVATRLEINGQLIRREDFFPYLEHMAEVDVRLYLSMLAGAGRHSARDVLPRIEVPTLIIAGDRDGFTPPGLSEEMHQRIAGSELVLVEGGSHTAPIERPAEVTRSVSQFLDRHLLAR